MRVGCMGETIFIWAADSNVLSYPRGKNNSIALVENMTNTTTLASLNNDNLQQAHRAQLIARLGKTDNSIIPAIAKRKDEQTAPLSYSQQGLWIMSQLEPDNPVYNVAGAVQFDGLLNIQALQHSLAEVVRRHEILRSRFVTWNQQGVQQVIPFDGLQLTCLELSGFRHELAMEQFQQVADDFIRQPFRLAEQPPIRVLLFKLSERQHILLLTLHHIVSDRWSVGVLMQEIVSLYGVYGNGKPTVLPELPIQYGDYCVWLRQQPEKWSKHLDYWQQKLAGAPPLLVVPSDRPRPAVTRFHGNMYSFDLSAELSRAVKELGKHCNATLFMVMAAALNTLLYRYTGMKDICIGYPVAGRSQSQTASLIGFFVNTLVLRCQFEAEQTFLQLLIQIRDQALQDQAHHELSFGQLLEAMNPVRHSSHSPLFQVMLTVLNVPMPDFKMKDLLAEPLMMNSRIAQFDLTLLIEERNSKLHACFEYNTDLFDVGTIARMSGHLQMLLKAVASQSGLPLHRVPLMSQAETHQMLNVWSGQEVDYTDHRLIHQVFEARAQIRPDKSALVFAGQVISYRELDKRAKLWTERLLELGAGPECCVGVCAVRSVDLIVGLLAVLKAGAAYVPLDPNYPENRLDYMLNDAGIKLILTQSALVDRFQHRAMNILCLDESVNSVKQQEKKPVVSRSLSLDNTAYIIYTSGSTGRPKGVAVSHRNLLHSTLARTNYYREPLECFLLLSSFAFDSSVAGIFWTLSQGGCLCLPQDEELTNPAALSELISQYRVTHLLALPSFYTAIINDRNLAHLNSLQAVIVAGEACSGEVASEHHRKLPKVRFYNEYGPTEATVWSSVYQGNKPADDIALPIGRAIDNVRIYILDNYYQPVPVGISGELCISGAGLAQAYINQPALTAEKFIPNPFTNSGERLYKTGDLARFRVDGDIEFLGRIDNQVKIRGYRIELGEIEERLQQHPAIKETVVLVRDDGGENKRLVAYLVAHESKFVPEPDVLKVYLKQTLPEYMIPSVYISLDELPLMPNGKRDYRALLNIREAERQSGELKLASNQIEAALLKIWQEVLGLESIGIDTDFFEQGGHSLAVIQVKSRIQSIFNVDVPTDILFESSTIELLAADIAILQQQQDETSLDELLKELEQLSDEEVSHLLAVK